MGKKSLLDNISMKTLLSYLCFALHKKINVEADSRSKKNYNPAACGTKTTFTER